MYKKRGKPQIAQNYPKTLGYPMKEKGGEIDESGEVSGRNSGAFKVSGPLSFDYFVKSFWEITYNDLNARGKLYQPRKGIRGEE